MKLKIQNCRISENHIQTALVGDGIIFGSLHCEAPLVITGELLVNGKIISQLTPRINYSSDEIIMKYISSEQYNENSSKAKHNKFSIQLIAELTDQKIEYITQIRESNANKSIEFTFRLYINTIKLQTNSKEQGELFRIKTDECVDRVIINQEKWINSFSAPLGIGDYYLVELRRPSLAVNNKKWSSMISNIDENLSSMKYQLQYGDWQRTIEISRMFFENIRIGDKRPGNQQFKIEFTNVLLGLQYDQQGVDSLFDAIRQMFEFTSKFIHEKDKQGNYKPRPIAKKEDAYFVYSLAVNLSNMMFEKIESDERTRR